MRIIAGSARGCQIFAPKGNDTRPTQDKVRESLFNILQRDVPDARVLDLFAGSGALALEAVSRGATEAVLVDRSQDAVATIRRNIEKLRMQDCVTVLKAEWSSALEQLAAHGSQFDLVFLDPPYRMHDTGAQCSRMADLRLLSDTALMVIEHDLDGAPTMDERFVLRSSRRYGDTEIHFFDYVGEANE